MLDYNNVPYYFNINISLSILKSHRQDLSSHKTKFEKKLQVENTRKEYYLYTEEVEKYSQLLEGIDMIHEEIECMKKLKTYLDIVEMNDIKVSLKSKWLIEENLWLITQVNEFQEKLVKLEKEWIVLGAERHFKLTFFKMRYLKISETFPEVLGSCELLYSEDSEAYEPEEMYSADIMPFCKIVRENMLEWRNDLAIIWCNDILNFFIDKEGKNSNNVADLYSFIGRIYKINNQLNDAKSYFTKALQIQELKVDNENEKGINQTFLGIIYEKQNKIIEAEIHFKNALQYREASVGRFHPDISDLYCRLGKIYNKMGKWQASIDSYSTALPLLEHMYDKLDFQILNSYLTLGDNYTELKMEEKARMYIEYNSKLRLQKKSYDETLLSPFYNLLKVIDQDLKHNRAINLVNVYGSIQKCCSLELIVLMSKFFIIFNHKTAEALLKEWSDLSMFPYETIKFISSPQISEEMKNLPKKIPKLPRTSSNGSISSFKSARQSIKNLIKSPLQSMKKRIHSSEQNSNV